MAGGVYKIDTSKLDPNSVKLLQGLGVPISQISSGEIQIDSLPSQIREVAGELFAKMGLNAAPRQDNPPFNRFGGLDTKKLTKELKGVSCGCTERPREVKVADILREYSDTSRENADPKLVGAVLHYFVDPKKYPPPEDANILLPGENGTVWRISVEPNGTVVPGPAAASLEGVRSLSVLLGDRIKKGYLTCIGQKKIGRNTYIIYTTARHNLDQVRALYPNDTYMVNDKVMLAAWTLSKGETPPRVIEIGTNPSERFVYTVSGLGSDPKYVSGFNEEGEATAYKEASPSFDKYMLFRGLNKRGDSGSPVVDDRGRLVGIILGGDDHLTVAAYADMETLKRSLKIFMEDLE